MMLYVRNEVEKLGFPPNDVREIEVATEEIIVNIINYGYCNYKTASHLAHISISCHPFSDKDGKKGISISIEDKGVPYNPLESQHAKRRPLHSADEPIGGLGIHLVLKLMDNVHYERDGERNTLVLVKYIKKKKK